MCLADRRVRGHAFLRAAPTLEGKTCNLYRRTRSNSSNAREARDALSICIARRRHKSSDYAFNGLVVGGGWLLACHAISKGCSARLGARDVMRSPVRRDNLAKQICQAAPRLASHASQASSVHVLNMYYGDAMQTRRLFCRAKL